MTAEQEQWSNLRWMQDILRRPLSTATVLPVRVFSSGESAKADMSRSAFFAASEISFDPGETQLWFEDARVDERSLDVLRDAGIDESCLVVGYELSAQTKRLLSKMGVTYVDIWLHPVRFYDDILFAFQSNNAAIHAAFGNFHVPESQFFLYADRIRVQTYKGWHRVEADIPPDSAAFIGQTLNDKSVCEDGRMLSVLDYKDAFDALGTRSTRVFYQRHPYLKKGDEKILAYVRSTGFSEISAHPTYRMLASPNLREVVSISSSVVHEAKYFDKETSFLFRPIIEFDDPEAPGQFHSICQDFVSPHFWSAVLAPVADVLACEPVLFRESKDKIRDMLGFYWSYGQVDKVEATRLKMRDVETKIGNAKASGAAKKAAKPGPQKTGTSFSANLSGATAGPEDFDRLKRSIDRAKVVSFDIFDTLLERVVANPDDVFILMGRDVHERFPGTFSNFLEARKKARALAASRATGEEVRLVDRYEALAESVGLDPADGAWLNDLELEFERRILTPRKFGFDAFTYAKSAGKRVILISDTFYDRDFVEARLEDAGYRNWDQIYLSSEAGVLKHTGRLFSHVVEKEQASANKIVHVGDNPIADVKRGREAGLETFEVPSTPTLARNRSPLPDIYSKIGTHDLRIAVSGLVARRIAGDVRDPVAGFTHGSVATFGYCVLGPIFFGMAAWVLKSAKSDGVRDLFFLSRDGDIVKRCYDVLAAGDPEAPKSHYILASRRSVFAADVRDADGILRVLEANFTPMPLSQLIQRRFGLDITSLDVTLLARHGFTTADDRVNPAKDAERLRGLAADPTFTEAAISNAEIERDRLLRLWADAGLTAETAQSGAIVDIGHLGSLQAGIQRLLNASDLRGYYFATYKNVERTVLNGDRLTAGYYVDRLDVENTRHSYTRNILMFEAIFLNAEGSFLRVEDGDNGLQPVHMPIDGENARVKFARDSHGAIVEFCKDMVRHFGPVINGRTLTGNEATSGFVRMLESPEPSDAELFRGLTFENQFSGRDINWIISYDADAQSSIWKSGARALAQDVNRKAAYGPMEWRRLFTPVVAFFVGRIGNAKDVEDYRADPAFYFVGLTNPSYRKIGRLLYPRAFR